MGGGGKYTKLCLYVHTFMGHQNKTKTKTIKIVLPYNEPTRKKNIFSMPNNFFSLLSTSSIIIVY